MLLDDEDPGLTKRKSTMTDFGLTSSSFFVLGRING